MLCSYNLYFYLILLFVLINSMKRNKSNICYFRSILIRNNRNKNKIIYLVNQNAGLANTLRGMSSTICLSFFIGSKFYLSGWNSIIFYFNFPNILIHIKKYEVYEINNFIYFRSFNNSVIKTLKENKSIVLTDIHGFMNYVTHKYFFSKQMKILKREYYLKTLNSVILNNIIQNEFFSPTKCINKYIQEFYRIKKKKLVLGIHIRSGIFGNNFTENYFSNFVTVKKYFIKSLMVVKNNNISFLFSISDNEKNLKQINEYYKKILINISFSGNIIHSKFALYNSKKNNNAIRIVSEFILLSNCDIIIGTKRSSFSAEACRRIISKKCFFI